MIVTLYPPQHAPITLTIRSLSDLQEALGAEVVAVAKKTSMGDLLINAYADGLPPNTHYPGRYVGPVVLAPKGWRDFS